MASTMVSAQAQASRAISRSEVAGARRTFMSVSGKGFFGSKIASAVPRRAAKKLTQAGPVVALFGTSNAQGTIYDFTVKSIEGKDVPLSQFKGKVLMIVNVASQCGFTPQYKEFVELYNKYNGQGLEVIAFPCNQFGSQEPGTNGEIKAFAQKQGAKFPIMAKVDVNGSNASPLWEFLKKEQGGLLTSDIKWNFTKFLVDRSGKVVKRYASTTAPLQVEADVKALL